MPFASTPLKRGYGTYSGKLKAKSDSGLPRYIVRYIRLTIFLTANAMPAID